MSYLLDTHTFIWSIMYSSKLPTHLRGIIEDVKNTMFVSTISFWEISLKHSLGKLDAMRIAPEALPDLALRAGFRHLALFPDDTANYHKLNANWHKDPFDRMLIWQALQKDFTLITKDKNIKKYQSIGLKTIW